MNYKKEIDKIFERCPICDKFCFSMKSHMHKHVEKEITQEEYDEMFKGE